MRKLCDCTRYYCELISEPIQRVLKVIVIALSFLAIIFAFGYVLNYLFIDFDFLRVIAGSTAIYTFIYLNRSMQGGRRY